MRCTLTSTNGGSEVTSEVQRLHALVQAGAGNAGQVVAKGFGAGQVPVYVALGLAGHLGGVVGKFHSLRACAAVRSILRWANLSHLKFAARMQRLPNRLPALDGLRALRSGMLRAWATARAECVRLTSFYGLKKRRVSVVVMWTLFRWCPVRARFLPRQHTRGRGNRGEGYGEGERGRTINLQAFR